MKIEELFKTVQHVSIDATTVQKSLIQHGLELVVNDEKLATFFYNNEDMPIIVNTKTPTIVIFDNSDYNEQYIEDLFIHIVENKIKDIENVEDFAASIKDMNLVIINDGLTRLAVFSPSRISELIEQDDKTIQETVHPGILGILPYDNDVVMCRESIAPISEYDVYNMVGYMQAVINKHKAE